MYGEELVQRSCNYIKSRQAAVVTEYDNLHSLIAEQYNIDTSGEEFAKQIKARFESNLQAVENFFANRTDEMQKKLTNRLYYNPIDFILACGLHTLGEDESHACKIAQGKWRPQGYYDVSIPELGAGNFWGSTEPSIHGNILYLMNREKNAPVTLNQQSSFLHVTPLRNDIAQPLLNSEYLYQNGDQFGLLFAHTGYVYNGNRIDNVLYTQEKAFAPKDCSQYVQEMLDHQHKFITEDMLYMHRTKMNEGYIRKDWADTPVALELNSKLKSVPIEDVQPGDIHVKWDFSNNGKNTKTRTHAHGHTTIVFSKQGNEVLTLGDGQAVPYRDGFGLETYSAHPIEISEDCITETRFYRAIS